MSAPAARLFRDPSFRSFWLGQLISIFGDRLHYLALLALIVERAHDRMNPAPELALIPAVSFLPAILLGPLAGALVDTWNTRRVLVVSDFIRGLIVLAMIPACARWGLWAAFPMVFLLFVANTFFLPARSAIVPDLVGEEDLVPANSLATLAAVLATVAGSFAGGVLVERIGWRWGFAADAITYFLSVLFLAATRPAERERSAPMDRRRGIYPKLRSDIREGARITLSHRAVLGSLLALICLWVAGGALHVAGTVLIRHRAPGFVSGVGGVLSLLGLGMVVGTLLLTGRGRGLRPRFLIAAGLAGTGGALILFAVTSTFRSLALLAFAAGIFVALLLVTTESVIQGAVTPEARGRVFALRDFATRFAVLVVAGGLGLALGRRWIAPEATVGAAGGMLCLAGVAGWLGWKRV